MFVSPDSAPPTKIARGSATAAPLSFRVQDLTRFRVGAAPGRGWACGLDVGSSSRSMGFPCFIGNIMYLYIYIYKYTCQYIYIYICIYIYTNRYMCVWYIYIYMNPSSSKSLPPSPRWLSERHRRRALGLIFAASQAASNSSPYLN